MSTIDQAAIDQFSADVHQKAQQLQARLRGWTKIIPMSGERFFYDGLGQVEAQEIVGRNQEVSFSDIDHNRRLLRRRRFFLALPIDASDERQVLLNPQGLYSEACAAAMERVYDRVVIEAMFASVTTGRDAGTTVTFASDGGLTINATAGTTYEKLLESMRKFINKEVGTAIKQDICLGVTGDEHEALMQETELTSGDFSRQYAVDGGRMTKAAGFDIVLYGASVDRPMLAVASTTRDCFAMTKKAMVVGLSESFSVSVKDRPDLVETKQVQVVFDLGAVRTEGIQIQKFQTTVAS